MASSTVAPSILVVPKNAPVELAHNLLVEELKAPPYWVKVIPPSGIFIPEVTWTVLTFATVIFASGVVNSFTVNFVPSKVRLPLSSNTPPVPAVTTLPEVKLSDVSEETYAVAAFTAVSYTHLRAHET